MKSKKELRQHFKSIRQNMPLKSENDRLILNKFKESYIYNNLTDALIYVSSQIEVDTRELIEMMLNDGIKVAVPLSDPEKCTMTFYYIGSLCELEKGTYGIFEPRADTAKKASFDEKTVCIVPGLSFDKNGYRLGFGKGYYDRFLDKFDGISVGLCYDECMSNDLIHDEHDKKVDYIITDKNLYKCGIII